MTSNMVSALPAELLVRCLAYLALRDLHRCQSTCRLLRDIVASSSMLQYKMELEINGMIDGPPGIPGMETASSRLAALRAYLNAWNSLDPRRETVIPLDDRYTGLYELYGGVHAIGSKTSCPLRCLALPSLIRNLEQKDWLVEHPGFTYQDFGMDPSQDLLMLIEFHKESLRFRVHIMQLSTGAKHPLAKVSFVVAGPETTRGSTHSYQILAMDDILVIHIHREELPPPDEGGLDHISVINWKKGTVVATYDASPGRQLAGFAYLTSNTLLIPSYALAIENEGDTPSIDIFRIPDEQKEMKDSDHPDAVPSLILLRTLFLPDMKLEGLRLPRLIVTHFSIRSDPAPFGHCSPSAPVVPFMFDALHRMFVIRVEIAYDARKSRSYSVFVPAATFMDAIKDLEIDEEGKAVTKWEPPTGDDDDEEMSITERDPEDWGWEIWGPQGTRLMDDHGASVTPTLPRTFVCYMFGMRCMVIPNHMASMEEGEDGELRLPVIDEEDDDGLKGICMYDFSPLVVKREAWRALHDPEASAKVIPPKTQSLDSTLYTHRDPRIQERGRAILTVLLARSGSIAATPVLTMSNSTCVTQVINHATSPAERIVPHFAGTEGVSSSLPYLIRSSKKKYDYRTVMMDGENVVLFMANDEGKKMKVLTM